MKNLRELQAVCRQLLEQHRQPVLVERYLPGREFTVGIVGTGDAARSLGVIEVTLLSNAEQHAYSYENKENCEECVEYILADDIEAREAEKVALAAWRGLGCRDGGRVDLRSDDRGRPQFMEVNPLAGLNPEHSDLPIICSRIGMPYQKLIEVIVTSARRRVIPRRSKAVSSLLVESRRLAGGISG